MDEIILFPPEIIEYLIGYYKDGDITLPVRLSSTVTKKDSKPITNAWCLQLGNLYFVDKYNEERVLKSSIKDNRRFAFDSLYDILSWVSLDKRYQIVDLTPYKYVIGDTSYSYVYLEPKSLKDINKTKTIVDRWVIRRGESYLTRSARGFMSIILCYEEADYTFKSVEEALLFLLTIKNE